MTPAMALVVLATAAAPTTAPITEADAVALALHNSPQVKFRSHFIDEARALTEVALRWNNPLLRFSGLRYDRLVEPPLRGEAYDDHPLYHSSIALRWSPPELGQRRARAAEGLSGEAEARMDLALARRDTTALVRKLHAEILSYDAQLALGRDVIEQRQKLRTLVQSRLEQHAATLLDQSLSDVDYLDAMTELARLEVRRRAAYDELLIQLGLPAGASITLAPSGQTCTAVSDPETLASQAQKANPRLQLYRAQLYATEANHRQKSLALFPWFDYFQVGYGFSGNNNPSYVAFQAQLILPLLDWKRADRRALTARHEGLVERIHADERELTDLVLRTTAAQAEQVALVQRYRDAASVVESGLLHLRQAMAQGQITNLFEIVQVQTRLLATQRSYLRAELDCKLYQIELERVTSTDETK